MGGCWDTHKPQTGCWDTHKPVVGTPTNHAAGAAGCWDAGCWDTHQSAGGANRDTHQSEPLFRGEPSQLKDCGCPKKRLPFKRQPRGWWVSRRSPRGWWVSRRSEDPSSRGWWVSRRSWCRRSFFAGLRPRVKGRKDMSSQQGYDHCDEVVTEMEEERVLEAEGYAGIAVDQSTRQLRKRDDRHHQQVDE